MPLTPPPAAPPAAPTAPGDAPSRANPTTFRVLADAFVVWQVGFRTSLADLRTWLAGYITWAGTHVTEIAALQADVDANAVASAASAASAAHLYAGSYAVAPATRPGGGAIQAGDQYFDSVLNAMMVYRSGAWASYEGSTAANAAAALTSKNAAALSETNAAADAADADAARILAESARDAALIAAGVYVDEPTGRAAVANGVAFKVQGSGDVAAYEYRRVDASSSTLIATYPSKALIDALGVRDTTYYFEGEEVFRAIVDEDDRVALAVMKDGSVKVPSLVLSADAEASVGEIAARSASRPATALEALGYAARRRVDLVMLGDSNQFFGGYGWDHGFNKALTERFGMYATAIYGGTGTNQGGPNGSGGGDWGAQTGAPAALEAFDVAGLGYSYVAAAATFSSGFNGFSFVNVTGVDTNANWRMHYAYGTFASGAGSFRTGIRRGDSPFTTFVNGPLINTNTGAESYVRTFVDLPAAVRAYPIECKWYNPGGTVITGPFVGFFARGENIDKDDGVSCHTLLGAGGFSLYDFADTILGYTRAKLVNYFSEVRRLQVERSLKPIVVVFINAGLNDRNETSTPSWGYRASTDADSAEAFLDNLEAIAKRIEDVWEVGGWDKTELFFLVMPSHPVSDPDEAELVSYRKAASAFAATRQRSSLVDLTNLTTSTEMLASGWYQSGGADTNHLTQVAYEVLAGRVVNLIPTVAP